MDDVTHSEADGIRWTFRPDIKVGKQERTLRLEATLRLVLEQLERTQYVHSNAEAEVAYCRECGYAEYKQAHSPTCEIGAALNAGYAVLSKSDT